MLTCVYVTEIHEEDEGITECLWQQKSYLYGQHSKDLIAGMFLCEVGWSFRQVL